MVKEKLLKIYNNLLKKHSHQGWWPIKGKYHPKSYDCPKDEGEAFEIAVGAILTQNTSWKNVEKVLQNLQNKDLLNPTKINKIEEDKLAQLIKSSGYFNQKAKKLKEFCKFYTNNKEIPTREQLLSIWGIGKETADSILLYSYKKPVFVVDAYTKRLFNKILNINFKNYDEWQNFFHKALPKDYKLFNEFHALIVEEGKIMSKNNLVSS